jgi:hypothetical protein
MATRAQIRFATREEGVTFSEHPNGIHAQFYVHNDGYPEFLGIEIANSLVYSKKIDSLEIEKLDTKHGDLNYIYYIWQTPGKTTWISIFQVYPCPPKECEKCGQTVEIEDECIFVGEPQKLLEKYDTN